jgi:hypothetical protein
MYVVLHPLDSKGLYEYKEYIKKLINQEMLLTSLLLNYEFRLSKPLGY